MRPPALALLGLCVLAGGCQPLDAMLGTLGGLSVVTLTTMGRTVPDVVVSFLRDRDCSAVRLEEGRSYCVPADPPPDPPELCTRTLGTVNCWAHPALMPGRPVGLADAPAMTPAQIVHGAHHWPDAWSAPAAPAPAPAPARPPAGTMAAATWPPGTQP